MMSMNRALTNATATIHLYGTRLSGMRYLLSTVLASAAPARSGSGRLSEDGESGVVPTRRGDSLGSRTSRIGRCALVRGRTALCCVMVDLRTRNTGRAGGVATQRREGL